MDETGIVMTTNNPPKVLLTKGKKQAGIIANAGRCQLMTVNGCFIAANLFLPPFMIFASKRCNLAFLLVHLPRLKELVVQIVRF